MSDDVDSPGDKGFSNAAVSLIMLDMYVVQGFTFHNAPAQSHISVIPKNSKADSGTRATENRLNIFIVRRKIRVRVSQLEIFIPIS